MIIHTCSEGITLSKKLESDSAAFYESMASKFSSDAETFLAFAKENKKNIAQVERSYFGVITDAIEGCYAFNLNTEDFTVNSGVKEGTARAAAIQQAVKVEEKIIQFYTEAAEQSQPLMADVPRTFSIIARKRNARLTKLNSL
jgi:hypothetical protein